jgi:predicted component of type VI protein secretion system
MEEQSTFQLVMGRGPQPGQIFELHRTTASIGRDPGNHVVVNDPQVSRQHARITPQGGLLILEDLNSTNGTTVNGMRITGAHTLAHGDEIGLGDNITLTFYGHPSSDGGVTSVAPREAYAEPTPAPSSFDEAPSPAHPSPAPEYAQTVTPGYAQPVAPDYAQVSEAEYESYPEYYEDYPEQSFRNWALIGLGCILVAIIVGLLVAIYIYFFAPASIVNPIADFLAGFGIDVP